ncbi:hypothetical protein N8I77_010969 [Diaporthe amygdali]|uniref:F-box domain-containing protein n=1 Tax=Phomopsis amygdali TaxID=1214568 RepID=A0AAD9VY78_PHOAM|nr:hypothetical protein N8I77_010969 [Diaporthe amygdali]
MPKRTRDNAGLLEAQPPSKRKMIFTLAAPNEEDQERQKPRERRTSIRSLVHSFNKLRLDTPPIKTLPQELLLQVFGHLLIPTLIRPAMLTFPDEEGETIKGYCTAAVDRKDLLSVSLVCRSFEMAATTLLYRCADLTTAKSPGKLLLTLLAHTGLRPLIKKIVMPTYLGMIASRFAFAFSHDTTNTRFGYPFSIIPQGGLPEEIFSECGEYLGGCLLRLILELVPQLRVLNIPQTNLLGGPFTKNLVLQHLTMLRITLMAPSEAIFVSSPWSQAFSTFKWLSPDFIILHFPALVRLVIESETRNWSAYLVNAEKEDGIRPGKYVRSLGTKTTHPNSPALAEWDLMSLSQPIFHPSKLHTLYFDKPGKQCHSVCEFAHSEKWDLNRFLESKGSGLRTLSLDWEWRHYDGNAQGHYFGAAGRLTTLGGLANLTHLTVSLQALFGTAEHFNDKVDDMRENPEAELERLVPASLQTLRISEFLYDVVPEYLLRYNLEEESDEDLEEENECFAEHNSSVYCFLKTLQTRWLLRGEGRELWFRRYDVLDLYARASGASMGRKGLDWVLGYQPEGSRGFERVLHPPENERRVWYESDEEDENSGQEKDGEDKDSSVGEDIDGDSDGERVAVYQDDQLVLV